MKFSQDFIERVRDASNLVTLIGQHVELKRSGTSSLVGLCPFPGHQEKSPSFSVSEDKQLYHCFGCGKGGNIFTFLKEYRGFSFPESVTYLAEQSSIPLEMVDENNNSSSANTANYAANFSARHDEKQTLRQINAFACDYFYNYWKNIPKEHPHRDYAKKRGLTPELVQKFRIGISSDQWDGLDKHLQKNNIPQELSSTLGLIKKRNKGDGYFDIFRERLIFPILSTSNEVLGFGGRILGDGNPKYLNSPETPIFHKGKTFYGLHETAKFIRSADEAIVVEGYMDLIALYRAGIQNVVAVLGTALTVEHAKLLKRYTKNIIVLMDGDAAGNRAGLRSLPILLSQGLYPKRISIPDGGDPDDYININGAPALKKLITQADEFYLSLLDEWMTEGVSSLDKIKLIDKIHPILVQISDKRLKSLYIKETVDRLGVDEKWLLQALNETSQSSYTPSPSSSPPPPTPKPQASAMEKLESDVIWPLSKLPKAEIQLLQVGLKSVENWKKIQLSEAFEKVSSTAKPIFLWVNQSYRQAPENFAKLPALLASKVDRPSFVTHSVFFSQSPTPDEEDSRQDIKCINDCLNWIYGQYLKEKSRSLTKKTGKEMTREQMEQFMNIQKKKRSLGKENS